MRRLFLALLVAALAATAVVGSSSPTPAASVPPAELVIMTMGDSITCGTTECGLMDSYRTELARLLDLTGQPYRFVVESHGSWSCGALADVARAAVARERPHFVLLNCGTNESSTTMRAQYERLLNEILQGNGWATRIIASWIIYSAVPPAPGWLIGEESKNNDSIWSTIFGPNPPGNWWVDGRIAGMARTADIPEAYLDYGGVHPTAAGYTAMGRLYYTELRKIYPTWPAPPVTCGLTGHRRIDNPPAYVSCVNLAT